MRRSDRPTVRPVPRVACMAKPSASLTTRRASDYCTAHSAVVLVFRGVARRASRASSVAALCQPCLVGAWALDLGPRRGQSAAVGPELPYVRYSRYIVTRPAMQLQMHTRLTRHTTHKTHTKSHNIYIMNIGEAERRCYEGAAATVTGRRSVERVGIGLLTISFGIHASSVHLYHSIRVYTPDGAARAPHVPRSVSRAQCPTHLRLRLRAKRLVELLQLPHPHPHDAQPGIREARTAPHSPHTTPDAREVRPRQCSLHCCVDTHAPPHAQNHPALHNAR